MFLSIDIRYEYSVAITTTNLPRIRFTSSTRIFLQQCLRFVTGLWMGAWCREFTTCHFYVGPLFDRSIQNELVLKFDIVENIFLHNI